MKSVPSEPPAGVEVLANLNASAVIYVERHYLAHSLRLADALIGATAIERSLPLATANDNHYRVIEDLVIERFRP